MESSELCGGDAKVTGENRREKRLPTRSGVGVVDALFAQEAQRFTGGLRLRAVDECVRQAFTRLATEEV